MQTPRTRARTAERQDVSSPQEEASAPAAGSLSVSPMQSLEPLRQNDWFVPIPIARTPRPASGSGRTSPTRGPARLARWSSGVCGRSTRPGACCAHGLTRPPAGCRFVLTRGACAIRWGSTRSCSGAQSSSAPARPSTPARAGAWRCRPTGTPRSSAPPATNNLAGATCVFTRTGTTWTQQGSKLVGTGATGDAGQGSSVALSGDENTALVGGDNDNSGADAVGVRYAHALTQLPPGTKMTEAKISSNHHHAPPIGDDVKRAGGRRRSPESAAMSPRPIRGGSSWQ
jgi:hypothetical protein